ncbi:CocE/NonD family hydrolase [Streptomyces yerevanensis]|uniref:CocE/NonD family hydrolase n=1 Tax=Streptomyces yerevanensis TaxID=66378 RepID=UPI000526CC21|nr:CocE/NonD family hydrolase [Streptomyces yerevanensis]
MTQAPPVESPEHIADQQVWRQVLHIPVRDGILLAADLYAEGADPSPRPVILERTPYGRRAPRESDRSRHDEPVPSPEETSAYFVRAGYHVVRQDCRGRGDSQGTFVKYLNEGPDGADTVEWIAAQPWCDGQVAMMGVSYSAHAQTAAAAEAPGHLAAMFLDSGGFSSAYDAGMRMGGAFELKQVTWAFRHGEESPEAERDPLIRAAFARTDLRDWFSAMPWRAGASPLRQVADYEEYLLEQWRQDAFGTYWRQPAIYGRGSYDRFPDVPSLHMASWYDPYVRSTIENFTALDRLKDSPAHLVMGPWTHGQRCVTYAGDVDFGPDATLSDNLDASYLAFRRRWFDAVLGRGGDPGALPRVRYFLMGGGDGRRDEAGRMRHGGRWRTDSQWPPTAARETAFYLHTSGELTTLPQDAREAWVEYDFDPDNPVPTLGGQVTSGEPVMVGGAFDQVPDARFHGAREPYLPLNSRPDVISLTTPPLTEPLTVTGPVTARLFISSSAPDTDFTVKLIDVHPPNEDYPHGFAMNLTEGIFRCRFHKSFEHPEPLSPGEVYEIRIPAPDTANRFEAGHRLRVDISSSDFPRFDVNSNTGEPEALTRRKVVATNRVHMDAAHPSAVLLWVGPDQ